MLELLKVVVQPVAIERDPDGRVTGEKLGEAVSLYTPDSLVEFVAKLRQEIEAANAAPTDGDRMVARD